MENHQKSNHIITFYFTVELKYFLFFQFRLEIKNQQQQQQNNKKLQCL